MPMATKLGKVVTCHKELSPRQSHDPLVAWSSGITKQTILLYSHYHRAYGHQTWKRSDLHLGILRHKAAWPSNNVTVRDHVTNWKHYMSPITMPMAIKLCWVITYNEEPPLIESHGLPIKWSWEVTWQIKYISSPIALDQWLPNMTKCGLIARNFHQ